MSLYFKKLSVETHPNVGKDVARSVSAEMNVPVSGAEDAPPIMDKPMHQTVKRYRHVVAQNAVEEVLRGVDATDLQTQISDGRSFLESGVLGLILPLNRISHAFPPVLPANPCKFRLLR